MAVNEGKALQDGPNRSSWSDAPMIRPFLCRGVIDDSVDVGHGLRSGPKNVELDQKGDQFQVAGCNI